jgi:hypothetical protein
MKRFLLIPLALCALTAFAPPARPAGDDWVALFDGKDTKGWHTYGETQAGAAWKVQDSALHLDATSKTGRGDLVTDGEYDNKYNSTYETGPEMQVLDNDGNPDGKNFKHRAGDLYDLIPCSRQTVKPVGQWNRVEIRLKNGKLRLSLNDTVVVETKMWTDDWNQLVAGSKFAKMPGFATFHKGHISIQDHGGNEDVWYKDIQIKQL